MEMFAKARNNLQKYELILKLLIILIFSTIFIEWVLIVDMGTIL